MSKLWKTKLAAWLHDPAEKALILLRDKEGHEWGTVKRLRDELGINYSDMIKAADWYASAADRPQFPLEDNGKRYAQWTQVDFSKEPILKHPLTGDDFNLHNLSDIAPGHIKAISEDHFRSLIVRNSDGEPDIKKTFLNYWRFGPEIDAPELKTLWQNLPADTRIPDHSIWAHLDIVSAFSGAMANDADNTPALLSVSFGPVQGFISESRSTSDLWAGSHLLARIAWEGMKVICEELGPDAILFPNLRGVPLVDVWLRDEMGLPKQSFTKKDWSKDKTDANPLFAAALPNKFVAIIPADQAKILATTIEKRVREFVADQGDVTLRKILDAIDEPSDSSLPCYEQLEEQLRGFPEVYWASVPWSLAQTKSSKPEPDAEKLNQVISNFYPANEPSTGFLNSSAWKVLQKNIELDGAKFYKPNPGVLYPALYELLDRVAAAAKSARPFDQTKQEGYRSSLNGEREWLTLDRNQLNTPPGKRQNTLWTKLQKTNPSWAKKGEHLDALNTLKRLWPTLVSEEVSDIIGAKVNRYVVSTHTLALAVSLDQWLDNPKDISLKLKNFLEATKTERVALPRHLMKKLKNHPDAELLCKKLPCVIDFLRDTDEREEVLKFAEHEIKNLFGNKPEAYYGMILLDGDRMGAWLAGNEEKYQRSYQDSWHPAIRASVEKRFKSNKPLHNYLKEKRPASPARHQAISQALNHFSIKVVRFVIEDCFKGKLIYAGGDDVLAFICVDDLLPAMTMLRYLYSGSEIPTWVADKLSPQTHKRFKCKNGYVLLDDELLLTMGEKAEASAGAVVVHHQAPLGYVLRQLRIAESQAKNEGGRNAFSLRIIKRAGGEIGITDKWFHDPDTDIKAPELLSKTIDMLSSDDTSRRAAYHSISWLKQLPPSPNKAMLQANLAYQFGQQGGDKSLAYELASYAASNHPENPAETLENMLMVAEFLARETRRSKQTITVPRRNTA